MVKNHDSYAVSRTNATKYAVAVDGPMLCPGRDRCRFCWCEDNDSVGASCQIEQEVSDSHERHYRRVYDHPELRAQVDDLDYLLTRMVNNDLRRRRILFRMNQAWNAGDHQRSKEFALTDRYLAAALNEYQAILRRLAQAQQVVHDSLIVSESRPRVMPMAI